MSQPKPTVTGTDTSVESTMDETTRTLYIAFLEARGAYHLLAAEHAQLTLIAFADDTPENRGRVKEFDQSEFRPARTNMAKAGRALIDSAFGARTKTFSINVPQINWHRLAYVLGLEADIIAVLESETKLDEGTRDTDGAEPFDVNKFLTEALARIDHEEVIDRLNAPAPPSSARPSRTAPPPARASSAAQPATDETGSPNG